MTTTCFSCLNLTLLFPRQMTISEKLLFCTSLEPGWRKVRKIGNALEEKKKDEDGKEQGKEGAIR